MLSLTIALIVINLTLGGMIILRAHKDRSAQIFFTITLVFSLLSLANYFSLGNDPRIVLSWIKIEMLLAAVHTFLFFAFVYTFSNHEFSVRRLSAVLSIVVSFPALITAISPYLFSGTEVGQGGAIIAKPGLLFPVFAIWLFGTMVLSMRRVVQQFRQSTGTMRSQWLYLLIGTFTTYLLLIASNFIFAGMLGITTYLKYTPVYSLPIVVATAYAIIKHNLFNMKVITAQAFVIIIAVIYFAKFITSGTTNGRIQEGVIFLLTAYFGFLLVRSVKEEIRAREKIAELAQNLSQTNSQLQESNERLRIMDQRKSEFVSIASHQLRTPVTAIKGYTSLLLENAYGELSQKFKDPIQKMYDSSERLVLMINDFLNISKIEQGTMTYNFSPLDMRRVVTDLVQDFHVAAGTKQLDLASEVPGEGSFMVNADDSKIRQIISNILDNSIKYTPKGSIRLILEKRAMPDGSTMIQVHVKDTGIGLSQDDIYHLFGKFNRGSEGSKVNTSGSGLGLYVAKKMMEEHKGRIWVESEGKGKGSVFSIELPEYTGNLPK